MKKALIAVLIVVLLGALAMTLAAPRDAGESHTLYGNVDIRELALSFRQPGRIASVEIEEGIEVAQGDIIATLDDEPLREAVAVAEAQVALAQSRLARLERGSRPQEIEQARATVAEAEAHLAAATQELTRKQGLLTSGASSEREVESARERHDAAVARLTATRETLDLAEEGFRAEEIATGRAEVVLAEAELERVRTTLADAVLLSPSAGTVLTRAREPGAIVSVGTPIAVLSLRDPVVVRAYVPETRLGDVPPGTVVEISTDSSSRKYRGRVGFVSPRAEFTPKNVETPELRTALVYRLRIIVEDADAALLQGMPVTVHLSDSARPTEKVS